MSEPLARERADLGTVVSIRGSVVDARFSHRLPPINHQIIAGPKGRIIIEVVTHLSSEMVRGIALTPTPWAGPGLTSAGSGPSTEGAGGQKAPGPDVQRLRRGDR